MKSTKGKIGVLILVLSFAAGGCGEKPMTLTGDEEAVIVNYAAHVVSKFNTRQPDGLVHVPEERYQEKTSEDMPDGEERDTQEEEDTENDGQEHSSGRPDGNNGSSASGNTQSVSLTEALGIDGVTAECSKAELAPSYVKPDYYSLDASAGKTFLILNILLTNTSENDIDCDMLSRRVGFVAEVNGNVRTAANTTILLNDLGTYQGTIPAGQSVETVLLFEVPADITEVSSLKITIEAGGTSKEAAL